MWYLAATCVKSCWQRGDGRAPRPKGLHLPHRREYSGNTCQGNHSPDALANVKIKSLQESVAR